jgi:Ice-binding-like
MNPRMNAADEPKCRAPDPGRTRRRSSGSWAIAGLAALLSVAASGGASAATAPVLGTAGPFGVVSSTFTNTNAATTINGNVCFTTGPSTGFTLNGTQTVPCAAQVGLDQNSALATLNGETCTSLGGGVVVLDTVVIGTNKPGTIPPGCYSSGGAMNINTLATVTLSGSGVYIFRSGGALGLGANAAVSLTNGATAANVFWTSLSATTFGANATSVGTIIDAAGISFGHLASLNGRALAFGGTVTADANTVTVPAAAIGPAVLFASVLPGSRSVELGNPATIFAMMMNSGTAALGNCRISLLAGAPAGLTLDYQTTNPATNALTGSPDTPVTIAGNGQQSFVISFHGTSAFSAPALPLDFDCDGAPMAAIVPGVDTVDLVMSSTPIADIIALVATPSNNGIIEVPVGGAAAFAVASINLGATTPITVSVDTGAATLPVALTICETNASTGQCFATPAAAVSLSFAGGAEPTFSIFLHASGTIAFAPATSRVFVRFKDAAGGLHGSTSVAIEAP